MDNVSRHPTGKALRKTRKQILRTKTPKQLAAMQDAMSNLQSFVQDAEWNQVVQSVKDKEAARWASAPRN